MPRLNYGHIRAYPREQSMEGNKFIQTIRLNNILSFGPDTPALSLEPLNVLIGPNASGKSNLIAALSLLAAAPSDIQAPTREGGGIREWPWKGDAKSRSANLEAKLSHPSGDIPIRYRISFSERGDRFALREETIESSRPFDGHDQPYIYYHNPIQGNPLINFKGENHPRRLEPDSVLSDQSILSQRKDPDAYPELTLLADKFSRMAFYREWNMSRFASPRLPQPPDLQQDRLLEDASNLGVVLSDLLNHPGVKTRIVENMRAFMHEFRDLNVFVSGGTVQIFFQEEGLSENIPASRLSDGSLRYLCLLAVLCHPTPPPVICIEEPELGLHPDMISHVAKLLVEASARSQIFVTTHSDILVDALTNTPEAIIVCEKIDGATQMRRLDLNDLEEWLDEYRLGEVWMSGAMGGTR